MNSLIKKFKNQNVAKWLMTILPGFFLFFVLYFYEGFNIQQGVSYSGHGLLFRSVCFGIFTSLAFFINEFYLSRHFIIAGYWKKFLWLIWEIFIGTNTTFLLFNYFWSWTELYWDAYFLLLFEYTSVMIIPIAFSAILGRAIFNTPVDKGMLLFHSENGKHKVNIKPENLMYMKSEDNYIDIYHIQDGEVKRTLVRNSLKNLEREISQLSALVRCHRSYMVNQKKINQIITVNRQTQLILDNSLTIPVSKKYHASFAYLQDLTNSPRI